jgi:hypothetical protein
MGIHRPTAEPSSFAVIVHRGVRGADIKATAMVPFFMRLLRHPWRDHRFLASRSYPGMETCKLCRLRRWPGY